MVIEKFKEISPQLLVKEPMSKHTSFRIGGPADVFISVSAEKELAALIKEAKLQNVPFMIVGNGSNMLVSDNGIRGLVIQIAQNMSEYEITGTIVKAQAGILMSKLASAVLKAELTGFEPLSGIPGTLGGGIFMNAGAYGGELKDIIKSVTYIDDEGNIKTIYNSECAFGYRKSVFSGGGKYILSAVLELEKGDESEIRRAMADYNKRRSDKQPLNMPSAGSTFKRPDGYFAGKLIQDAGLMGYSIGGAQVSEKHAGFIINKGGATAKNVLDLIEYVQKTVKEKFGVDLEPEVRLVGD
ncbi:MAG: UDP-N-acetylmuramate dehydrogenase [Oscillospiraceae bacterium]|nr:UDP-N-acetylmuramate dehydrogenase [Oscillospiraceae bacterium]